MAKSKEVCVVCSDKSSGFHYNVQVFIYSIAFNIQQFQVCAHVQRKGLSQIIFTSLHLRRARAAKDSFAARSTRNQSTNLARQNINSSSGFFLIFSSQFGNVCHINLTNRKRCQECRLAKCYQKVIPPSHMQGGNKHGDNKKVDIWLF